MVSSLSSSVVLIPSCVLSLFLQICCLYSFVFFFPGMLFSFPKYCICIHACLHTCEYMCLNIYMYIWENIYCHIVYILDKIVLPICHDQTVFIGVFILCFRTFSGVGLTFIKSLIGKGILTAIVDQVRLMSFISMFLAPFVAFKLLSHHNILKYLSYHNTFKHMSYYPMYKHLWYLTTLKAKKVNYFVAYT